MIAKIKNINYKNRFTYLELPAFTQEIREALEEIGIDLETWSGFDYRIEIEEENFFPKGFRCLQSLNDLIKKGGNLKDVA